MVYYLCSKYFLFHFLLGFLIFYHTEVKFIYCFIILCFAGMFFYSFIHLTIANGVTTFDWRILDPNHVPKVISLRQLSVFVGEKETITFEQIIISDCFKGLEGHRE